MTVPEAADYDEFATLEQQAALEGIPWRGQPRVKRRTVLVDSGHRVSALVWGVGDPQVVLVHGSGQNAHAWDSLALALDRPLVAFDLPGHGHSDWREDSDYRPAANAEQLADAMVQLALRPAAVVGTSLGGLTVIRLAAACPQLVQRAVIIEVMPGCADVRSGAPVPSKELASLVDGPLVYSTFDEMVQASAAATPGRPIESVRASVLHNSRQLTDGRWAWRYDRIRSNGTRLNGRSNLWQDLSDTSMPMMLVRTANSPLVHDSDREEFRRRRPDTRFEQLGEADQPNTDGLLGLAALIDDFIASS